MSKLDSTDTYLNLNTNQFNTWIKEFEVKYQEIENNTKVKNNLEIFNNSINNSDEYNSHEFESDESEEIDSEEIDSDDESSNVFIVDQKASNTSSTKGSRLLYNKSVTLLKKSIISDTPISTNKNLISSESSSIEKKPPKNKKKLTSNESSLIEKTLMINKKNRHGYNTEQPDTESKIDEILSLKQLNNMIPVFSNRSSKISTRVVKTNVEVEDVKISTNNQKKLGDHALYKFILNRRR